LYRTCLQIVTKSCNYVILPSSILDFNNLIMKLRDFLYTIESEIRRTREKNLDENEFYRRTTSRLRSINAFEKHLGDLLTFWEAHKGLFWSFVSMDMALVRKRMMSIVHEKAGIFSGICDNHNIEFTPDETSQSDLIFIKIRDAQRKQLIVHSANDSDLMILADCIIYVNKRLTQGILYLITDDNELFGASQSVVLKPSLIIDGANPEERLVGFEPVRPKKFIDDFKKIAKSK